MGKAFEDKNQISPKAAIFPQAMSGTTDIVGTIIDTRGFESVTFILTTDAIAASSLAAQLLIEDGNDSGLSDAAAVDDAYLIGTEAATAITQASDKVALSIGYVGAKRYVRATLDITTNNGTDKIGCTAFLGNPIQLPL